jgi:hypothetical protein
MQIYPLRPEDLGQVQPPRDLLGGEAGRGDSALAMRGHIAATRPRQWQWRAGVCSSLVRNVARVGSCVVAPPCCVADPTRREGILLSARTRTNAVNGPFALVQGFKGAFVRYPIYVNDVGPNETFGFK